jgi:hypothetical protein
VRQAFDRGDLSPRENPALKRVDFAAAAGIFGHRDEKLLTDEVLPRA